MRAGAERTRFCSTGGGRNASAGAVAPAPGLECPAVNVARLILDYVYICENRGEILDFGEFIPLWLVANEITEEHFPTCAYTSG